MGIPLNSILNLSESQVKDSKIELNMLYGKAGQTFIDRWLEYSEDERRAGAPGATSYWGWYGKQRNFHEGQWVFSFVRLYHGNEWLFVSAAKVLSVPKDEQAEVEILTQYAPLFGRMIIDLEKGQTFGRYCFNLGKYLEAATVREILPVLYSGETFQGYDRVSLPYAKLDRIFKREILPTYHDALESVTGVYCLTDRKTGKLYIGSATGTGGVAQRWGSYLGSKHGGNKKLQELHDREGGEYFERYFTFTLLEYYGLSYDSEKILQREQWWKDCLDTRAHGYNDN
ncbi:GIY-YIG nuclease family protein [Enorma phocaeensis]|uniref:GIY-YIG nuclease family protein n=1 Tax=Enorma phocaeensis TaxID=1871019 RepID=UPI003207D682